MPVIALAAAVLVLLLAVYPPLPVDLAIHDLQRMALTLLAAVALPMMARPARGGARVQVAALLVVMLLALLATPSWTGLALTLSWVGLLAVASAVYGAGASRPVAVPALWGWAVLAMALVYTVRTGAAISAAVPQGVIYLSEIFLGFANVRHFAQLMPMVMPLLAAGCLPPAPGAEGALSHRAFRPLCAVALVAWCVLLWLNGSAGAFYAIALALAASTLMAGWHRSWRLLATMAVAALAAMVLVQILNAWVPVLSGVQKTTAVEDAGRLEIWRLSISALAQQPWLGLGPGQYPLQVAVRPAHPHNAVLAFAADYGLPATVLLVALLWRWFSPLRLARRLRAMAPADARWPVALTAAAYGAFAHAQVSGVTVMPMAQLLLAVTLGLLLAAVNAQHAAPCRRLRRPEMIMAGLLGMVLIGTVALSWRQSCPAAGPETQPCHQAPSFWSAQAIAKRP